VILLVTAFVAYVWASEIPKVETNPAVTGLSSALGLVLSYKLVVDLTPAILD
jgi:hypothetical protein